MIETRSENLDKFWTQHNHPIELSTYEMALQRLNYRHKNPVEIGFVEKEEEGLHSFVEIITGVY